MISTCPLCGAIHSVAPIETPDGIEFMLISKPKNGNFSIPPSGLIVNAFGCNNCGAITLGNQELIGQKINK